MHVTGKTQKLGEDSMDDSDQDLRKVSYIGGNEGCLPSAILYSAAKSLSRDKLVLLVTDVNKEVAINGNFKLVSLDEFLVMPVDDAKVFDYIFFNVGNRFTPKIKCILNAKSSNKCSIVIAA